MHDDDDDDFSLFNIIECLEMEGLTSWKWRLCDMEGLSGLEG